MVSYFLNLNCYNLSDLCSVKYINIFMKSHPKNNFQYIKWEIQKLKLALRRKARYFYVTL